MSDVLFKITCVTCTARLSVRNEEVIGQILACPKCGSMVQVTPPQASTEATAKPASVTEEVSTDESSAGEVAAESVPPEFSMEALDAQPAATPEEINTEHDDAAALETPATEPQSSGYSLVAWITAGVVALVTGVGTFSHVTSGDSNDEVASTATSKNIAEDVTASSAQILEEAAPPVESSVETSEQSLTNEEISSDIQPEVSEPKVEPDVPPSAPSPQVTPSTEPPSDFTEPITELANEEPTEEPKRTLLIDPLDLDPEGLDLSTFASASAVEPVSVASDDALAEVEQPLEVPDQPKELPRVQLDNSQPLPQIDTNEVLATRIPSFEAKAIPLCEFLNFVTRMSALPVSAEPEQLRLAGVSSTKGVSVSVEDTTVEGLLTAALKPLRLTPVVANDQVVLGRVGLDNLRKIDYPVGDLLDSSTTAKSLADRVREFIAPESWNDDSEASIDPDTPHIKVESDKLVVTQQERRQYEILRLLETLRVARGLSPRSKYPIELLQANSPYVQLSERLSAPATFTFSKFTPAQEIFQHWQNEIGLALLVDWPSLAKLDLYPQTRVRCSSTDQPWTKALDEVLTPLGLAWQAVDGRTLRITTVEATRERTELAFYPLEETRLDRLVAVEQFLARLTAEGDSTTSAKLFHDRSSNTLLVLQSPTGHRKLAAWLIEQGWSK